MARKEDWTNPPQPVNGADDTWDRRAESRFSTRSPPIHRHRHVSLLRRSVRIAATVLTACAAVAMLGAAGAIVAFDLSAQPVLTGSMRPSFGPGAAVITREVRASDIRPGDVIVFRPPNQAAEYAHRVASLTHDALGPVITTKGDANPAPDKWKARLVSDSVPVVVTSIPHAGRLMAAVQGPGARVALALFAGLVVLVVGTRRILGPRPAPGIRLARVHAG